MTRTLRSICYCLAACCALVSAPALANETYPEPDPRARIAPYAALLNDMSERRRRVIYTPFPVSPQLGVVRSMVHMTDGSAAFARTDLVLIAPIPIVITRAYHSGRNDSPDFGSGGWTLTLAERITRHEGGALVYRFGNGRTLQLDARGKTSAPADRFLSDVTGFTIHDEVSIQISTRTGMTKDFERYGNSFRLTTVADQLGNAVKLRYTNDFVSTIEAGQGARVTIKRDDLNRIQSVSDSTGRTVGYSYDDDGRLVQVTDLRGETWSYRHGSTGLIAAAMTPADSADLEFAYDAHGRVRLATIHGASHAFDYRGHMTTATDAEGFSTEYESSPAGLTVGTRNALGVNTRLDLDRWGRPQTLWRKKHKAAEAFFDETQSGGLTRLQIQEHQGGESFTYQFDSTGRISSLASASSGPVFDVAAYGPGLTPELVKYADGTHAKASLSRHGDLREFRYRDGRTYNFSAGGPNWSVAQSSGERVRFRFDGAGRLTDLITADRRAVKYEYDLAGLRERTRMPSDTVFEYLYDASGSLFQSTIEKRSASSAQYAYTYEFGPDQQVNRIVDTHSPPHRFGYTDAGLPLWIRSTLLPNADFHYDELGRLTTITSDRHDPISYHYGEGEPDVVSQLDSRTLATFNQQRERATYGSRFETQFSRIRVAELGVFAYDERIHELVVSTPPNDWSPTLPVERTLQAMRLPSLFADGGPDLEAFSMPSNRLFVPPEFWAVNCCFCYGCPPAGQNCDEP